MVDAGEHGGGQARGTGDGGVYLQKDLFFTAGGVECLGGEREEGFDAHSFFNFLV